MGGNVPFDVVKKRSENAGKLSGAKILNVKV